MPTIPTFEEAEQAVDEGHETPLDIFVHNNEPAEPDTAQFRKELQDLVNFLKE